MARKGSMKGVIKDDLDNPLEDVNVAIISGPAHRDMAAITSSDGSFSFGNLQPGEYVLKAYRNESVSEDIPVTVYAMKQAFVEVWLNSTNPYQAKRDVVQINGMDDVYGNDNIVDEI